jgi:hypothetical protein
VGRACPIRPPIQSVTWLWRCTGSRLVLPGSRSWCRPAEHSHRTSVDGLGVTPNPKINLSGGIFRAGARKMPPDKLIKRQQCPTRANVEVVDVDTQELAPLLVGGAEVRGGACASARVDKNPPGQQAPCRGCGIPRSTDAQRVGGSTRSLRPLPPASRPGYPFASSALRTLMTLCRYLMAESREIY